MKTIAHITDAHLHEAFPLEQGIDASANWQHMLNHLTERGIKNIVFGGDIGAKSAHTLFSESLSSFRAHIVLGNHDQGGLITLPPAGAHGHYYLYEDDAYRYIILDSSADRLGKEQLLWLLQAVQTDKKIILFVHHPILSVPCYVERKYAMEGREIVKHILFDTHLEVTIFCGHYHLEDERTEQNVRQMVTPALSYQMIKSADKKIDNSTYGERLIYISPEKIETEVIMFNTN